MKVIVHKVRCVLSEGPARGHNGSARVPCFVGFGDVIKRAALRSTGARNFINGVYAVHFSDSGGYLC